MHINLDAEKFFKQELAEEVAAPVKFSGFVLSDTLYASLEDQVAQICKDGTYLNLVEILPDCFKKSEHTQELLSKLDQECRLMADESHLCSVNFLNKCLARFEKRSEQEAIACVKRGMRPEKLMNKQEEESKEETPTLRKNKSRGGGKRGKAAQDNNAEQSRKSNNLDHIQAKVCPFDHAAVMDTLNADS